MRSKAKKILVTTETIETISIRYLRDSSPDQSEVVDAILEKIEPQAAAAWLLHGGNGPHSLSAGSEPIDSEL